MGIGRRILKSTMLRRLVLWWLVMFWQGGFLFYGTVVVTIGMGMLTSPPTQGHITQRVTNWLNLAGVLALAAWAWDIAGTKGPGQRLRWRLWILLTFSLLALALMHPRMDALVDSEAFLLLDDTAFYAWHRWYLRVSTAQWLLAVALSWATLRAWRSEDGRLVDPNAVND